jgi:hypothetical protein
MSYNKDSLCTLGLGIENNCKLVGADLIENYAPTDKGVWTDFGFPADFSLTIMVNSNKEVSFSVKRQKTFDNGLFGVLLLYNYLKSMDVN